MKRELTREMITRVMQCEDIETATVEQIFDWFSKEKGIPDFAPDGSFAVDPRDGSVVVYNAARAKRPYDNKGADSDEPAEKPCPICEGKTTGIIDVTPLSKGYTFVNKNLFPGVYLPKDLDVTQAAPIHSERGEGGPAYGLHLVQWTSTLHDLDWHNMEVADLVVVLERLAALENKLLTDAGGLMPKTPFDASGRTRGCVSIIKNYGAPVGGSLTHGHQQIIFSNAMPTQLFNDARFKEQHGVTFAEHLLKSTDESRVVKRFDGATLLVPEFMRRPYWSMLVMNDTKKQYLHELTQGELTALAEGWGAMARTLKDLMPRMGKTFAYNALVHNGPGAGLYVEFLPFTQEDGGYERLGLWVCQERPENAAEHLRARIA